MLTREKLKAMLPRTIFAEGIALNSPDDIFMTREHMGSKLKWIAKTGDINDWAIYIHWEYYSRDFIITNGDKVMNPHNIKRLVPCDDEAFAMYRL